jgi:hypothetical protein
MLGKLPVVHEAPENMYEAGRQARQLAYLVVLAQEAHFDVKKMPPGEFIYGIASPYERRGFTTKDIENWINICDPAKKPAWDPIDCFRDKARAALKPRLGLAAPLLLIGGAAFLGAFLLSGPKR